MSLSRGKVPLGRCRAEVLQRVRSSNSLADRVICEGVDIRRLQQLRIMSRALAVCALHVAAVIKPNTALSYITKLFLHHMSTLTVVMAVTCIHSRHLFKNLQGSNAGRGLLLLRCKVDLGKVA